MGIAYDFMRVCECENVEICRTFCIPGCGDFLPGRLPCQVNLERETGIEPATFSLARRCSTTEPLPHICDD